ncbi:hypothetical protein [Devosia sp.]|uniref:hypothetical protein n=1 Tax=Devosia sp. TaxID=1871048 RepID=UPI003A933965
MSEDPKKPDSPFKLNSGRIVMLVLGVLLVLYTLSALFGGLNNYQQLREAASGAQQQDARE